MNAAKKKPRPFHQVLRFEHYEQNLRAVTGIIRLTHVINKQNIHKKENESTRQSIFYSSNFLIKRYIEMFLFSYFIQGEKL